VSSPCVAGEKQAIAGKGPLTHEAGVAVSPRRRASAPPREPIGAESGLAVLFKYNTLMYVGSVPKTPALVTIHCMLPRSTRLASMPSFANRWRMLMSIAGFFGPRCSIFTTTAPLFAASGP
jgi:hypothetical protein